MCHLGWVPHKACRIDRTRTVGRTLAKAQPLWDRFHRLQDAGAFAVKAERVAAPLPGAITARTASMIDPPGVQPRGPAKGNVGCRLLALHVTMVNRKDTKGDNVSRFKFGTIVLLVSLFPGWLAADISSGVTALESGDAERAAREFQSAYDAGDADGAFYLGRMFELGLGADPNIQQAAELFKLAAEGNSALGLNRLGLMYLDGQAVIKDFARGAELVCQAADLGDANAQFNCGAVFADGKGVEADSVKARDYWQKAADQDHIAAINLIALSAKTGDGVNPDPKKAFALFSRTAELGNPMGLYEIAVAYNTGGGTEIDKIKAYTFANIAASRAHPEAAALRDAVEAELTPSEITAGQTAAREWIAADDARAAQPGAVPALVDE